MSELTTLATKLQQQAAAGKLPAGEAVEQVLSAFLSLLGLLRGSLTASGGSAGSSKALAALDRCQEQANAGARMVQQAASKQGGVAPDAAVQHLATLLVQLAADLSAELVALGPADAGATAKFKFELPAGFGSSRTGSTGGSRQASGGQQAGGVQLGDALQELQGVLAGGVEQGLAAAGGAVKEVRAWCACVQGAGGLVLLLALSAQYIPPQVCNQPASCLTVTGLFGCCFAGRHGCCRLPVVPVWSCRLSSSQRAQWRQGSGRRGR
jgi:hypothetical protein